MTPLKYVLVIEYEGTRYHGFQWQLGLPTIQDELEKAIKKFCGGSSRVMAASRTDTGVHARGQVVSFFTERDLSPMTTMKALNHYLPQDIAVKAAYRADADFNVRRDALSREYCYYILNSTTRSPLGERFALRIPQALEVKLMNDACQLILGRHDFTSFAASPGDSKSALRDVYEAEVDKKEAVVTFRITADSFLPHQVRNTVGLLIRLGLKKVGLEYFRDVMEAKIPGLAGPRAPACGLCLNKVNYAKPPGVQQ